MSLRSSGLSGDHLHAAEAVEAEDEAIAGRDRQRRDDAAGDHDHAGRERPVVAVGEVGDPGERRERVLGAALALVRGSNPSVEKARPKSLSRVLAVGDRR